LHLVPPSTETSGALFRPLLSQNALQLLLFCCPLASPALASTLIPQSISSGRSTKQYYIATSCRSSSFNGHCWPKVCETSTIPHFPDNRLSYCCMKTANTLPCWRLSRPQNRRAHWRSRSLELSSGFRNNRTRDLPVQLVLYATVQAREAFLWSCSGNFKGFVPNGHINGEHSGERLHTP
jgi:hypothetical protein